MVEFFEIERDLFSEKRFTVQAAGIALFHIGFYRETLLSDRVYITLEPLPSLKVLRKSDWKELQQMFKELPPAQYYCQVASNNHTARRFAEFFGFVAAESIAERIEYVRRLS